MTPQWPGSIFKLIPGLNQLQQNPSQEQRYFQRFGCLIEMCEMRWRTPIVQIPSVLSIDGGAMGQSCQGKRIVSMLSEVRILYEIISTKEKMWSEQLPAVTTPFYTEPKMD